MQTFIKKLSRGSEFAVVVPEEVKSQYGLEANQVISFEVARRDNGIVVLHKDATIESVEGDTAIVFSELELDPRENDSFQNYEIYDYRVVAYSAIDESEVSIVTQFFDKVQMLTDNVFGMGDTDTVRANQLVLDYNGALYHGTGYNLGTTQLKFYVDRNKDFIVDSEYVSPYSVSHEGFDLAHFAYLEGEEPFDLGFAFGDGSSNVVKYDESSDYFYIPSEFLQSSSSGEQVYLVFKLIRAGNWKYGVKFRYFDKAYAESIGGLAMGQSADFANGTTIETAAYDDVIDYFSGINLPRTVGVDTGYCETLECLFGKYSEQTYENDNFPFLESGFYDTFVVDGFKIRGILRNGVELNFNSSAGLFIDSKLNIVSQIKYLNENEVYVEGQYVRIQNGDTLLLDVVLKDKRVKFSYKLNFVNVDDSTREVGNVDVYLTEYGKQHISDFEDFEVGYYTPGIVGGLSVVFPYLVSQSQKYLLGFTMNEELASSNVVGQDDLEEFVSNTIENFYTFEYNGAVNTSFSNVQAHYFNEWESHVGLDGKIALYPVFFAFEPYSITINSNSECDFRQYGSNGQILVPQSFDPDGIGFINATVNSGDESAKAISAAFQKEIQGVYGANGEVFSQYRQPIPSGDCTLTAIGFERCFTILWDKNINSIVFNSWGDWIIDASTAFSGFGEKVSFSIPEWGANIQIADSTFQDTNVQGIVPSWRNVISAKYTFSHCENLVGKIPSWGNLQNASGVYYGCSGLTGLWDETAPLAELMPSNLVHDASSLTNTGIGIRAYFTPDWGRFGLSELGCYANDSSYLFVLLEVVNGTSQVFVNFNSSAYMAYIIVNWDEDEYTGTGSGSHIYNSGLHLIRITAGNNSSLPTNAEIEIRADSNVRVKCVSSLGNGHDFKSVSFVDLDTSHLNRIFVTRNIDESEFEGTGVVRVDDIDGRCLSVGANAFANCTSLKSVSLSGCNSLGDNAFGGCTLLSDIVLGSVDNFAPLSLQNIGSSVEPNEDGIKCVVHVQETMDILKSKENFGWGASHTTLFRCLDGDLRIEPGQAWNVMLAYLTVEMTDEYDNHYNVVADSDEECAFRMDGMTIVAHYIDRFTQEEYPEYDEVINNSPNLIKPVISDQTEDSVVFTYKHGLDYVDLTIPVEVEHQDISEVVGRTYIDYEATLKNNCFNALVERNADDDSIEYWCVNFHDNLTVKIKYAIERDGQSNEIWVDVSNRNGADNNNGVYITADFQADKFILSAYDSSDGFKYDSTLDELAHFTGVRSVEMDWATLKSEPYVNVQIGPSSDVKYVLMRIDASRNFMNCLFHDDVISEENHEINVNYGEVDIWMPFVLTNCYMRQYSLYTFPSQILLDSPVFADTIGMGNKICRSENALPDGTRIGGLGLNSYAQAKCFKDWVDNLKTSEVELNVHDGFYFKCYRNFYFPNDLTENGNRFTYGLYYTVPSSQMTEADEQFVVNDGNLKLSGLDLLKTYKYMLEELDEDGIPLSNRIIHVNGMKYTYLVKVDVFTIELPLMVGANYVGRIPINVVIPSALDWQNTIDLSGITPEKKFDLYVPIESTDINESALVAQDELMLPIELEDDEQNPGFTLYTNIQDEDEIAFSINENVPVKVTTWDVNNWLGKSTKYENWAGFLAAFSKGRELDLYMGWKDDFNYDTQMFEGSNGLQMSCEDILKHSRFGTRTYTTYSPAPCRKGGFSVSDEVMWVKKWGMSCKMRVGTYANRIGNLFNMGTPWASIQFGSILANVNIMHISECWDNYLVSFSKAQPGPEWELRHVSMLRSVMVCGGLIEHREVKHVGDFQKYVVFCKALGYGFNAAVPEKVDCPPVYTNDELTVVTGTIVGALWKDCKTTPISVIIPNVETVEDRGFYQQHKIQYVSMDKLKSVGNGAFEQCVSLESVEFPELQTIGQYAFRDCLILKSIILPKLISAEYGAFMNCPLESVSLPLLEVVPFQGFSMNDASLIERLRMYGKLNPDKLLNVALPSAKRLESKAFASNALFKSGTFPVCEEIEDEVFSNCFHIEELVFGLIGGNPIRVMGCLGSRRIMNFRVYVQWYPEVVRFKSPVVFDLQRTGQLIYGYAGYGDELLDVLNYAVCFKKILIFDDKVSLLVGGIKQDNFIKGVIYSWTRSKRDPNSHQIKYLDSIEVVVFKAYTRAELLSALGFTPIESDERYLVRHFEELTGRVVVECKDGGFVSPLSFGNTQEEIITNINQGWMAFYDEPYPYANGVN